MLGNLVLNSVWVFEEDVNRLKWWILCSPLVKHMCARSLASPRRGRVRVRVRGEVVR